MSITRPILMKKKRTIAESSLANLRPQRAPDNPGGTIAGPIRLSPEDWQWLKTLPDGASYHMRQAVKLYRKQLEGDSIGATAE
jgi:hypothetical protein